MQSLSALSVFGSFYLKDLFPRLAESAPLLNNRWVFGFSVILVTTVVLIIVRTRLVHSLILRFLLPVGKPRPNESLYFRGARPFQVTDFGTLPERTRDAESIWLDLADPTRNRIYRIYGGSGCGKTSLVNAEIIPRLKKSPEFVPVYNWSVAETPESNLISELRSSLSEDSKITDNDDLDNLLTLIEHVLTEQKGKTLVLVLDQFEEIFVTVRDVERKRFFELITDAVEENGGRLRLIIVHREDFQDLVDELCKGVDPSGTRIRLGDGFKLYPFTPVQAEDAMAQILAPYVDRNPRSATQVNDFIAEVVKSLERAPIDPRRSKSDAKIVIPVELQIMGTYLVDTLRNDREPLDSTTLLKAGGKRAVFQHYLDSVRLRVCRNARVTDEVATRILTRFIAAESLKDTKSPKEIADETEIPVHVTELVLDSYHDEYILEKISPRRDEADVRYQLMHDELSRILRDTQDHSLCKAEGAETRLAFWLEQSTRKNDLNKESSTTWPRSLQRFILAPFYQPIPILESLRLWKYANAKSRSVLTRSIFGFTAKVICICAVVGYAIWVPKQQVHIRHELNNLGITFGPNDTVSFPPTDELMRTPKAFSTPAEIKEALRLISLLRKNDITLMIRGYVLEEALQDKLDFRNVARLEIGDLNVAGPRNLESFLLPNLESLAVSGAWFLNLEEISTLKLPLLTSLEVDSLTLIGLSEVSNNQSFSGLRALTLKNCGILDEFPSFQGLRFPDLETLKILQNDDIVDLNFLRHLDSPALESLTLHDCDELRSLSGLEGMLSAGLRSLSIGGCPVVDISAISSAKLHSLEELSFYRFGGLDNLEPLVYAEFPRLKKLSLQSSWSLSDLSTLKGLSLPSVQKLSLIQNYRLEDFSHVKLEWFPNLTSLDLRGCIALEAHDVDFLKNVFVNAEILYDEDEVQRRSELMSKLRRQPLEE